ncbi:MAG: carboxypeptidase-like regulatory domain-containing protein [Candidatus Competibacteraceae bacterium]
MKTNRFFNLLGQIMLGLLLLLVTILGQAQSVQGVIRGQIYQIDGSTPIGGATVEALGVSSGTPFLTPTSTDAMGSYSLSLPAGSYRVRAKAPGYARKYFDNVTPSNEATVLNVTDGSSTVANFNLNEEVLLLAISIKVME